jgi:carbon storage regulator CsrA
MLVLSRRPDEKILLPTVPAVIKVIATQTGLARIGIEAPPHVPILREELCQGQWARQPKENGAQGRSEAAPPASVTLELRNRLNNLILGLALLRVQLAGGGEAAVSKTLDGLDVEVEAMRRCLMGGAEPAPAQPKFAI